MIYSFIHSFIYSFQINIWNVFCIHMDKIQIVFVISNPIIRCNAQTNRDNYKMM